jgi:hypothetical protein
MCQQCDSSMVVCLMLKKRKFLRFDNDVDRFQDVIDIIDKR